MRPCRWHRSGSCEAMVDLSATINLLGENDTP
jgi:hypothetical protein